MFVMRLICIACCLMIPLFGISSCYLSSSNAAQPFWYSKRVSNANLVTSTKFKFSASILVQEGVNVYSEGKYIGIVIPNALLFVPNTAEFLPQAPNLLNKVVKILLYQNENNILITSHTSGIGKRSYELILSSSRAQKVASYLWSQGINNLKQYSNNMLRLKIISYTDELPLSHLHNIEAIQSNNRIQITSYPDAKDLEPSPHNPLLNVGMLSDNTPSTDNNEFK